LKEAELKKLLGQENRQKKRAGNNFQPADVPVGYRVASGLEIIKVLLFRYFFGCYVESVLESTGL
jgi:hypothetical protein